MRSFKEFQADKNNEVEAHVQAKHYDTNEYHVIPEGTTSPMNEDISPDPENAKRIIIGHDADAGDRPKGVMGLSVPQHMWNGTKPTQEHVNKAGKTVKATAGLEGMKVRNKARAEVYGSEQREPLKVPEIEAVHKEVLDRHFAQPKEVQLANESAAVSRLQAAKHLPAGKTASTTDDSEKTDTILHEKDKNGKGYMAAAIKGVAGHTVYTSGGGDQAKHRIVNTCPGQTRGCGGGVDAHGVANTSKGTCFAPQAEAQYPAAAIRRASLDQAKHDPKMTQDYILAHVHSIRKGAAVADKANKNFVVRPNTLNENDRSTRHAIDGLNKQRTPEGKGKIISYQYSKDNVLHDPENGVHVTHSNIGPKVIGDKMVKENVNRDSIRVGNTVTATKNSGEDFRNPQGNKTPAKNSYLVTNLPRGGAHDKEYQAAAKHIKYWDSGTKLSAEEHDATHKEGHFGGAGKPTTPETAHHGFKVVGDRKYEYQNQHILHPRMTEVNGHSIPSDSRFKDNEHMPSEATRFKAKNGKSAGGVVVTSATMSTSGERSNSSFTHRIDQAKLDHIKKTGEHEIDAPADQERARGHDYSGEEHAVKVSDIGGLKKNKAAKAPAKLTEEVKAMLDALNEANAMGGSVVGDDGKFDKSKFDSGVKKIAQLTDNNFHTRAVMHGARMFGLMDKAKEADDIEKQHIKTGHITDELGARRRALSAHVTAHAKNVLSPEHFEKFNSAF